MIEHLPVIMIVVALLGAYAAPLLGLINKDIPGRVTAAVVAVLMAASLLLAWSVSTSGSITYFLGSWPAPWGIEIGVDGPVVFMLVTITLVSLATVAYAVKELSAEAGPGAIRWYWTLMLLLIGSMMGIVMARDLFNLFVFVEIASLAACAIISIKGDGLALESTFRYLIFSSVGAGSMLFGIALTYMATGHLNMGFIQEVMPAALAQYPGNILAGLCFITVGLGVKAALFPLHTWLPDAHSAAPTPSSAILSGLVVKVFAFAYWRVIILAFAPVSVLFPVGLPIIILGSMATLVGSFLASGQRNLKRLLAYSTVAQIGYVFIGFGLGGDRAVMGALIYIMAHGMMKAGMFLIAGCIKRELGTGSINAVAGLARRMPVAAATFSVLALSMVGVPPSAGFIGKYHLVMGALEQGQPLVAVIIVVSTIMTALYLIPLVMRSYFEQVPGARTVRFAARMPAVLLAGLVVVLGVFPSIMVWLMGL